jgi:hypothetical protein
MEIHRPNLPAKEGWTFRGDPASERSHADPQSNPQSKRVRMFFHEHY